MTPCNLPLDRLAKRAKDGRADGRRLPLRVRDHRRLRRDLDGPRGHARLPRQPRGDRRLGRDGDARRALRRAWSPSPGCDKSLPGCSWPRPGSTCRRVFLYGGTILPGPAATARPSTSSSVFEAVGAHAVGAIERRGAERSSSATPARPRAAAPGCSRPTPWRSVGEALGMSLPGSASAPAVDPPSRRLRLRLGRVAVVSLLDRGITAPPDHDQGGLRERHRRGDGAGRLDQRRAPPAGHRPRGAGRPRARRLQPDRGARAAHRRHQAPRPLPHDRHRPDRRRPGGARASCSRRGCSTATA